jgi:hypothetical protein
MRNILKPVKKKKVSKKRKTILGRTYSRAIVVFLAVAVAGTYMAAMSFAAAIYSANQWNTNLDKTIHADNTQSVRLPDGRTLWAFGDTIAINGEPTVGLYGYPHDAFVTQAPRSQTFTAVSGKYGYGWQQVPNWSDNSYFWMSSPVVDKGVLYILGQRIQGASSFKVVGSYVAVFNASTLAFQKIVPISNGATGQTVWGGIAKNSRGGWWVTGTHGVSCYIVNCKVGDIAYVPFGGLADSSEWQVYNNVIPASNNLGTTLGIVRTSTGWDIFTKTGDAYGGSTIERLSANWARGNWKVTGSWPISGPQGTVTYGVAVHPEQAAPSGDVLVSYNTNDFKTTCWPLFEYLPKQ